MAPEEPGSRRRWLYRVTASPIFPENFGGKSGGTSNPVSRDWDCRSSGGLGTDAVHAGGQKGDKLLAAL